MAAIVALPLMMIGKFVKDEYIPRDRGGWPMMGLIALAFAAVWFTTVVTRSRYVAVKTDGVHARTRHGSRFVPWTDIASATRRGKTVVLFSHRNCELLRLSGMFENGRAAEQFCRVIQPVNPSDSAS
jgi:hypothetical protein